MWCSERADVDLRSGISEAHESYKQHADEVARVVTEGQATAVLLSAYRPVSPAGRATGSTVQRQGAGHGFNDPYKETQDATYVAGFSSQDVMNKFQTIGKRSTTAKPTPQELPSLRLAICENALLSRRGAAGKRNSVVGNGNLRNGRRPGQHRRQGIQGRKDLGQLRLCRVHGVDGTDSDRHPGKLRLSHNTKKSARQTGCQEEGQAPGVR